MGQFSLFIERKASFLTRTAEQHFAFSDWHLSCFELRGVEDSTALKMKDKQPTIRSPLFAGEKLFGLRSLAWIYALLAMCISARGDVTYTELASFSKANGGLISSPLVIGNDGYFYGSLQGDEMVEANGALFRMDSNGMVTNFMMFPATYPWNGEFSPSFLCLGSDGNLYGTTAITYSNFDAIGFGKVFSMTTDGVTNDLAAFDGTNGFSPSGLIQGADGNFYGCANEGGSGFQNNGGTDGNGFGTIFRMTPGGTLTSLWQFNGTNGSAPLPPLVQAADGYLYGATALGGTNPNYGTLFKISTNGDFTSLASFDGTNFGNPQSGLTLGLDGNLYGTTQFGGENGQGVLFRLTTNGTLSTVFSFSASGPHWPNARLFQATDGNFYGAAYLFGTNNNDAIFSMTPEGVLTTLYLFVPFGYQLGPVTELIQGSDGSFYGGYFFGGVNGCGSIFRLTVPGACSPRIFFTAQAGGGLKLTWKPLPNRHYQVQYSTDLSSTNWTNLDNPLSATNSPMTYMVQPAGDSQRFFRVVLLP